MELTKASYVLQSTTMTSHPHHRMISVSLFAVVITLLQMSSTDCFSVSDESPITDVYRITPYRSASEHLATSK